MASLTSILSALLIFLALFPFAASAPANPPPAAEQSVRPPVPAGQIPLPTRFFVKTRNRGPFGLLGKPKAQDLIQSMTVSAGANPAQLVSQNDDYQIYGFKKHLSDQEYQAVLSQLAATDGVASVEEDLPVYPTMTPNDPDFPLMTDLSNSKGLANIDVSKAWDITTGSPSIYIALLDTGMQNHPDLAGRFSGGYDFISDPTLSGDGNGWDSDPHDTSYNTIYKTGAWHGLHTAGTIGAVGNNTLGTAGINWHSPIEPVRVLGWGGGYTSDVIAGLEWAGGLPVSGVPTNPHPARVFSLSLGGTGACPSAMQTAINKIVANGGIIVVAAGNSNANVTTNNPANCSNVIRVGADNNGPAVDKSSYSNYGSLVTISAPGDNILSTTYSGTSSLGSPNYTYKSGTSIATPHVSGVVSLMLSVDPKLNYSSVVNLLKKTAKPFPSSSWCSKQGNLCGAGIVDAYAAVLAAKNLVSPAAATATPNKAPSKTPTKAATAKPTATPTKKPTATPAK
ncbi:MAG: S8 family peptidase [Anaerolineaceae bacterium]|nr:S8 family peptidase [Anaerolineaceae bacterium]